ncbi:MULTISPECIES: TDT family transporter [Methylobacteriaceae]|uniref:C4-dicarboxylate transporter/malic acid transport protein n=2 Tax=Methylobacteriaceae TaxID=119045 RepID=C5AY32_METEA|nr:MULTISPECIES: TDT family transporter [Methylobacteriaceae]ACS39085.1 C4-dicarboxylate transporter/malic acid transport protein [Methylorubrum extorquens AM1]KQT71494.1 C4-dicarboxylate ABC transporter [Methylobacterium sp. Leaf465]MCE4226328.1 TDT family transporter [Methylobacterium sp. C25]MCP1542809.1 C4-dicarboxylate transporter/malic acid transport protein [Methylorubrum extorquens]MCP1589846.1 C4-dicarboxylate transporter/malic acid transport protein [Methylorubrum extorquens]
MSESSLLAISTGLKPLSRLQHPRDVIRQFTPNWFTVVMGTGVVALALDRLPATHALLAPVPLGLWLASVVLFATFCLVYGARWIFYFDGARRIFGHSTVSMFFGAIPMALATLLNGLLIFGPPYLGADTVRIALPLWWIDVALALICAVAIPYLMFTRQEHRIDQMTAVWLLPVVTAEVVAVSGGLLAPALSGESQQLAVIVTSFVLWGVSVPLALSILAILVLRMALHNLPPREMAASSWLSLGPLGTGALGLLVLGQAGGPILAAGGFAGAPDILRIVGLIGALILWGYGAWWFLLSLAVTVRYLRAGVPFNLGWWGYIFPLGVYALATLRIGEVTALSGFAWLGAGLVGLLTLLWLIVSVRTLRGAYRGELFVSPCLAGA